MDINTKASIANKYLKLSAQVKGHLDSFEKFCKTKNEFIEASPEKAFYGDSIVFLNSVPGKWIEFNLLDKTYRLEADYGIGFEGAFFRTYEIYPDSIDRSKLVYQFLDNTIVTVDRAGALKATGFKAIMSVKNHLGQTTDVPMTEKPLNDLMKNYIDFLWDTNLQKLFEKR